MKRATFIISAILLAGMPVSGHAAQQSDYGLTTSTSDSRATSAASQVATTATNENKCGEGQNEASKEIIALIRGGLLTDQPYVCQTIAAIDKMIADWRTNQGVVYTAVRSLNRNLDKIDCRATGEADACTQFIDQTRDLTREMLAATYEDSIGKNANLSDQIENRLPLILADSLMLAQEYRLSLRKDIEYELAILAKRWLGTRKFRLGLGLAYSYLPAIDFDGRERIDLSPLIGDLIGGSDTLLYQNNFSNQTYTSFIISAEVPFTRIDASFPNFSDTQSIVTPVQLRGENMDLPQTLVQTTISSKVNVDFDVNAKFSIPDFAKELSKISFFRWLNRTGKISDYGQFDYGFGIGFTGFDLENSFSTDVRFRTDPSTPFNGLAEGEILESNNSLNFNAPYGIVFVDFEFTDELQVGIEFRLYDDTTNQNTAIKIDDFTVNLNFAWYPTSGILGSR